MSYQTGIMVKGVKGKKGQERPSKTAAQFEKISARLMVKTFDRVSL
jgi:hypothetical protein